MKLLCVAMLMIALVGCGDEKNLSFPGKYAGGGPNFISDPQLSDRARTAIQSRVPIARRRHDRRGNKIASVCLGQGCRLWQDFCLFPQWLRGTSDSRARFLRSGHGRYRAC